jgi:hypothetical protein
LRLDEWPRTKAAGHSIGVSSRCPASGTPRVTCSIPHKPSMHSAWGLRHPRSKGLSTKSSRPGHEPPPHQGKGLAIEPKATESGKVKAASPGTEIEQRQVPIRFAPSTSGARVPATATHGHFPHHARTPIADKNPALAAGSSPPARRLQRELRSIRSRADQRCRMGTLYRVVEEQSSR